MYGVIAMAHIKKLSFEDYLALDDSGLECHAELINGELLEVPPEAGLNSSIVMFVVSHLFVRQAGGEQSKACKSPGLSGMRKMCLKYSNSAVLTSTTPWLRFDSTFVLTKLTCSPEVGCYRGEQHVISPTFPDLALTGNQLFTATQLDGNDD